MAPATADLSPLVRTLERHAAFAPADRDAVLALPFQVRALTPLAALSRAGQATRCCHLMLDGYAARYKLLPDGTRQILNILVRGDLSGLGHALFGLADHDVEMATSGRVATVSADAIEALAAARPAVARALWAETLFEGAIQREWIVNVGRRNARARLAHLLCEIAVRQDQAGLGGGRSLDLPFTQQMIADCAGLTSVHVNRVLQRLRRDGLIAGESRRVRIADWPALASEAGFDDGYLRTPRESAGRETLAAA